MREDESTFDIEALHEATQEAAFNNGPTQRVVHADGSVSIMREESTADEAGAVRRTAELRRIEADERELAVEIAMYADLREELVIEADKYLKQQEADIADFDAHVVEVEADAKADRDSDATTATPIVDPIAVSLDEGDPFEVGKVIIEGLAPASPDAPVDFRYDGGVYTPIEW